MSRHETLLKATLASDFHTVRLVRAAWREACRLDNDNDERSSWVSYYLHHSPDPHTHTQQHILELELEVHIRAGGGSQTFFSTHGNHLPSLSGVQSLKDFLHSDHLLE